MKGLTKRLLGALLLMAIAGAATARNDKFLLPIDPALQSPGTRQVLAPDLPLRFGKASAQGLEALSTIQVHAVVDPWGNSSPYQTRRDRLTDAQVCLAAFRKAVVDLQQRARAVGGAAIAGIVSYYNAVEMDSASVYECHVGHTRGVVDLRGQVVRAAPVPAAAVVAPPIAQPGAVPAAASMPAHDGAQPPRIASGYAAIDDVDALPYLSDRGRQAYREYLASPTPKAFAISTQGHWWSAVSLQGRDPTLPSDPTERALAGCERSAKQACKLYAVNGSVVWVKDAR